MPFSLHPHWCCPTLSPHSFIHLWRAVSCMLALCQPFFSVLGYKSEQDIVLVYKERLCVSGVGRGQKQRMTVACDMFYFHHSSPSYYKRSWLLSPSWSILFTAISIIFPKYRLIMVMIRIIFVSLLPKEWRPKSSECCSFTSFQKLVQNYFFNSPSFCSLALNPIL